MIAWWRRLVNALRDPFDVWPDTDPPDEWDDDYPHGMDCPTTEPTSPGLLDEGNVHETR